MPPREQDLTDAIRNYFRAQGSAVRTGIRSVDGSYAIEDIADAPPVTDALEETGALLAAILIEHLPGWYEAGWTEAAEQLQSELEMLMRDEADARRRAREIVPVIQTTTQNALRDEAQAAAAQAEEDESSREEALALLILGVGRRYEGWQDHRAELIARTESQSAGGRGGAALAGLVSVSQLVEKRNIDRGDDRVCIRCRTNTAAGWIPVGDNYPSGTSRRPHHPRCRCNELYRIRE